MPEIKNTNSGLDQAIDALFSETPGAPISPKASAPKAVKTPVQKPEATVGTTAPKPEPKKPETPAAETPAGKPAAPKAAAKPTGPKQTLSLSELQKMLNAPKPEKPLEKEPAWSMILVICSMILSMMVMVIAFVAAYFYFSGAIMSQILCVLFGILLVLFMVSGTFMLRKIEKGIREIKTKL